MTDPRSAHQFLDRASNLLGERGKEYDSKNEERSAGKVAKVFNIITGKDLTASEVWLLLQLLKDVRQWSSPSYHKDSAEDCIAYASLKAEALEEESYRGKPD